jgi:hypothetical protein
MNLHLILTAFPVPDGSRNDGEILNKMILQSSLLEMLKIILPVEFITVLSLLKLTSHLICPMLYRPRTCS